VNSEIFCKWLRHSTDTAHPSPEATQKNLEAINIECAAGVIMLSFHLYCRHRLQPLDVSFYGPLSSAYNQVMDSWMRAHPGQAVTQYQISRMLGEKPMA